ncbi:MAG: hypothetical protein U1F43_25400 [Myxococcota bacterium]
MRFEETTSIEYPATGVLGSMIWHLEELVPFMDNVSEIKTEVFDERPDGSIVTQRRWQGTAKSVPALMRPFVSKNSLAWTDHATWYPDRWLCEWRIVSSHSKYSSCSGINLFEPHPDAPETRTRCVIAGDFVVFGDKLPAIPKFLGLKMAPKLESIILGYMLPNFRQLSVGIGDYLAAKGESARPAGRAPGSASA